MSFHSPNNERRQSRGSLAGDGPGTPLRSSFNHVVGGEADMTMFNGSGMGDGGGGDGGGGNGLGNLADELADALSDGDEDEYYEDETPLANPDAHLLDDTASTDRQDGIRDSGVDVTSPTGRGINKRLTLTLQPVPNGKHHRRINSEYDGSEYGSDSDLESPGMPSSLVAKIDAVESLARRGTENNGGPTDGVFQRVTDGLRDLGSQSNVEGHATRLITAHSALSTHLTHQTAQLHKLTFPLLNPLAMPPDAETIDLLIPELTTLQDSLPRPTTTAHDALKSLHSMTNDLVNTISILSDTLHMSRQTTTTAARRLKSAKELVAELRRDEEMRDEGEAWLARGNWGDRLRDRECASECRDVIGGFEAVCNDWRARLLASAQVAESAQA